MLAPPWICVEAIKTCVSVNNLLNNFPKIVGSSIIGYNEFYKAEVLLLEKMKTKNTYEKQLAVKARDFLRDLILDKIIVIECLDFDKYGRLLGNLYIEGNEMSISTMMIEKGFAKAYDGGTKIKWEEEN